MAALGTVGRNNFLEQKQTQGGRQSAWNGWVSLTDREHGMIVILIMVTVAAVTAILILKATVMLLLEC